MTAQGGAPTRSPASTPSTFATAVIPITQSLDPSTGERKPRRIPVSHSVLARCPENPHHLGLAVGFVSVLAVVGALVSSSVRCNAGAKGAENRVLGGYRNGDGRVGSGGVRHPARPMINAKGDQLIVG